MSSPSTTETPTRSRRRGAELIDPESLMRIKSLHARARAVVEGFLSGIHRSPFHGFSAEFSEYREYSPGDDLRYLDWRLYARSDRYYVKRFEETVADMIGMPHAIAVTSATTAMHLALAAGNVGPGDEVLVSDFT